MEMTVAGWFTSMLGALPLLVWLLWWWNEFWYALPLKIFHSKTGTKLPPGHMGFPFIGELFTFLWYFKIVGRPDDFINSKRAKYGDRGIYRTHLFGRPAIISCSPDINKFVFQSDNLFPHIWPTNDLVGHNSLLAVQGHSHTRIRRYVSAAVNQPNDLRRIALLLQPRIAASLQSWAEKNTITAFNEVKKIVFENIAELFISLEPGPLLDELGQYYRGMTNGFRALPYNIPGTAYHHALKCRKKLMAIFQAELEKRKKIQSTGNEAKKDLMDGLMQIKDEEGKQLCDEEVLDNIVTLFFAGFESTVVASMWVLYYLAKFPNVLQQLREENMTISQNKKGDFITADDISQMEYTNKVVEETIRMANVSGFSLRSSDQDVEYQGYKIPKGWKVILWIRYIHTDPRNYEDPMCFNPDRWNQPAKPGTFQVFGGGSRICVGSKLARIQLAIFIHHLVIGYKWELINPDAKISYLPYPKPVDGVVLGFSKI